MEYNQKKLIEYLKFREIKDKIKNTINGDKTAINELIRFTKNKQLDNVNEKDMQNFIGSLKSVKLKHSTQQG